MPIEKCSDRRVGQRRGVGYSVLGEHTHEPVEMAAALLHPGTFLLLPSLLAAGSVREVGDVELRIIFGHGASTVPPSGGAVTWIFGAFHPVFGGR